MRLPQHLEREEKIPVVTVHLEVSPRVQGQRHSIACMPEFKEEDWRRRGIPCLRTNDSRAVSCPNCKQTAAYKEHFAQQQERGQHAHR